MMSPTYQSNPPPSVDIPGIAASIRAAVAAIPADKHGTIVLQATGEGMKGGLVVKLPKVGPVEPVALATVSKPMSGSFGWSVGVAGTFLIDQPERPQTPMEVLSEVVGAAQLLVEHFDNTPWEAVSKAWALHKGEAVHLFGTASA
jgi:hypothetical protein